MQQEVKATISAIQIPDGTFVPKATLMALQGDRIVTILVPFTKDMQYTSKVDALEKAKTTALQEIANQYGTDVAIDIKEKE